MADSGARLSVKFRDYSDEYTVTTFKVNDLEVLQTWQDVANYATTLETALNGAYLGTLVGMTYSQNNMIAENDVRPASGEAQREKGLRIFFHDDVTQEKANITIGTADFGALAQPGTDLVPLDHAEVAPIVAWIESNVEINDGNSVTCDRAVLVGRSS